MTMPPPPVRFLSRAWAAWHALWAGDADLRPLGCFRIAWALCAIAFTWLDRGRIASFTAGRFHVAAFGELTVSSERMAEALLVTAGLAAFLVLLGVGARLGAALFVATQGALFASDLLQFRNHAYLLLLTGAILAVSPAAATFSVGNIFPTHRVRIGPRWPMQLLKGQFLVVYLWAALSKLNGPFLDGWVLEGELAHYFPKSFVSALLAGPLSALEPTVSAALASRRALVTLSYATVILEFAVLLSLAVPRLRARGVWLGAMLHVGIAATMNVFVFGSLMLASYVLFLAPRAWRLGALVECDEARPSEFLDGQVESVFD